jgi:hypothetical protein
MGTDFSSLTRSRQSMPDFVAKALKEHGLMDSYLSRPAYQQNDYLAWINRAKTQVTQGKRLHQMLNELEKGGVYMNMKHPASEKKTMGD